MKKNIIKNTISLYGLSIAKIVIPLLTLPYLTRVLSKDCYGIVSFIKSTMQYIQIFIDFGFAVSGVKEIVRIKEDKDKLSKGVSDIFFAKITLGLIACLIVVLLTVKIPILKNNVLYTMLSFIAVFLTCFLFEYYFRGIEKMHIVTINFLITRSVSTLLTLIFVKGDSDILLMPIFDIVGITITIVIVYLNLHKTGIAIIRPNIKSIIEKMKLSFVCFISSVSTTAFGALNTLVVGLVLTEAEIADWSICSQIIVAIQYLYIPVSDGLYPEMVKTKDLSLIKQTLKLCIPVLITGCIATFLLSDIALLVAGGEKYVSASYLLKLQVPVIFFGFFSILFGWTTLGALGEEKYVTKTTIISALFQFISIILLVTFGKFSLISLAIITCLTEVILSTSRIYKVYKINKSRSA